MKVLVEEGHTVEVELGIYGRTLEDWFREKLENSIRYSYSHTTHGHGSAERKILEGTLEQLAPCLTGAVMDTLKELLVQLKS